MVHVPAKFRENTEMPFRVSAKTKHETDGRTDGRTGGRYNMSRAFSAAGDKNCPDKTSVPISEDQLYVISQERGPQMRFQ